MAGSERNGGMKWRCVQRRKGAEEVSGRERERERERQGVGEREGNGVGGGRFTALRRGDEAKTW